MKEAKINKYMTFHCSRHTFAINSIVLGIPIEVVSDLLGHSDLRTTQIYAKIVDQKRDDEMAKWGKVKN
jgi:site-specific recombinase XerD